MCFTRIPPARGPRAARERPASESSMLQLRDDGPFIIQSGGPTARDGAQIPTVANSSRALVKSDTCAHVLEVGS